MACSKEEAAAIDFVDKFKENLTSISEKCQFSLETLLIFYKSTHWAKDEHGKNVWVITIPEADSVRELKGGNQVKTSQLFTMIIEKLADNPETLRDVLKKGLSYISMPVQEAVKKELAQASTQPKPGDAETPKYNEVHTLGAGSQGIV